MTRSTTSPRHRLRKLAYTPLVAAVAAGTLCTGAGISTAATDTTGPATTDAPQSGSAYYWQLLNHTGQPIYGSWSAEMPTGDHSEVKTDKDRPWKPDDASVKATQYQSSGLDTTWKGHICFNKQSWDYAFSGQGFGRKWLGFGDPIWRLEADSAGALWVHFDYYDIAAIRVYAREPLKLGTGSC
ncbi:hypothetical protein R3Q06_27520 [Rhodococcus erythropolis]|uniref:hypothetical protein n=1 Tax=Rhodococcus erythropolis TaxID=1833 RepID=UPI00294A465E|nr:hypothetical protein [Rhodococcus erythropolis]MDV6277250.1 hypothetical protein [Rhodococcus erythropolis]